MNLLQKYKQKHMLARLVILKLALLLLPGLTFAQSYPLPPKDSQIIGAPQWIKIEPNQTLADIAREHHIGYYEILEANPQIDPLNLVLGASVLIPSEFILPDTPRDGVVINIAELRLYYYPKGKPVVVTVPVGIGRQGWETPIAFAKIKDKRENPTWTAPASVREDMAKRGVYVPPVTPPGPDNPLGNHAMRISIPGYVIHGTNYPAGVGKRTSAGCIRMYPEDVAALFNNVDVGTPVYIINEPFKAGWKGDQLYLEAHRPLKEQREIYHGDYTSLVRTAILKATTQKVAMVQWDEVKKITAQHIGIPQVIGRAQ